MKREASLITFHASRFTQPSIQIIQGFAGLGEFAAHAQSLVEVDGLGERGAGGGVVAAQGVDKEATPLLLARLRLILQVVQDELKTV